MVFSMRCSFWDKTTVTVTAVTVTEDLCNKNDLVSFFTTAMSGPPKMRKKTKKCEQCPSVADLEARKLLSCVLFSKPYCHFPMML